MQTVWGPIQIPYGVYGIRYRALEESIGPDADPIRIVWDARQIPCGVYSS